MTDIRRILDLEPGEAAYTPTFAVWVSNGRMFLNGVYPIKENGQGSFDIRLVRTPEGRLLADLSACRSQRFATSSPFGADAIAVPVDEEISIAPAENSVRRIIDMQAHEVAYISPSSVWVHDNRRMWLNGYTPINSQLSHQTPLILKRLEDGTFVVDLRYCAGVAYATAPDTSEPDFPIQVLRRVD